jgi:hypothetical protein
MVDSKYYRILGLEPGADIQTIRKRYRKLALVYHPDKNPSIEAKKKFIEIRESYEILIGRKSPPVNQESKDIQAKRKKSQEERIKEAKKRYFEQQKKEELEQERYYQSLFVGRKWRIIKFSVFIGIALSMLVTIDMFLPQHKKIIEISHYAKNVSSFNDWDYLSILRTPNDDKYWVSDVETDCLMNGNQMVLFESWLFHEPIKILCNEGNSDHIFPVKLTFFSFGPLMIIIFLLPAFTFFYRRKMGFYTILYYLSLFLSPILMLIFIFTNYHWFHLLGLGFI